MINILESHGVRVFSLVEETRHLDAYAYWHDDAPYVFLNTCKTGEHSRFDAAHELGHLVMHRHSGTAKRDAEFEANTFASEFLMPQADLIAEWTQRRLYTVADLSKAKQRWGVSVAALNYALHSAGLLTEWQKNTNFIELSRRGRSNEPNPIQHETSQIWAKILSAFWKRGMSLSHIANELCIPETELSRLLFNVAAPARLPERQAPKLTLVS
nr:ImmA/IrrE family metallo-endopeptidase [Gluconobacter cerinus]